MQHLGDFRIDEYLAFGVQLHRFSSGAVYAPTGNVTYTFYENNSTTGAPTGGNLAQLNAKTGLYSARVQLTTASGFEVGKDYFVHVEATVDGVAAAELFGFRVIANPKVDLDTIKTQSVTCAAGVTVLAVVGASTDPSGTGASHVTITVTDGSGNLVADCEVWVTSDLDGTTVIAGPLVTDDDGQVEFLLDAGSTYYGWRRKAGMNFTNPVSFVATGD